MNITAWRAYVSARAEGQVHPCMGFFLDPSKILQRPVGPVAPLTPKERSEEVRFWHDQEEYPAELWVDALNPFVRYVVHYQPLYRSCFGDIPALRMRLTLKGWKATELTTIRVRGIWTFEHRPGVVHFDENQEEVVDREGGAHLWVRMW